MESIVFVVGENLAFPAGRHSAMTGNLLLCRNILWMMFIFFIYVIQSVIQNATFFEADHLAGDTDLIEVIKELLFIQHR
jgi:D-mannonate dehydratase